ncbi:MAG TPA: sigma-54-dependent Fis family transcriptional regulator [Nitrospiraceae bacterium]|nr:sigma-54-dependent Fis family transcriptional regulator [Nitrospiraceae bacterium]
MRSNILLVDDDPATLFGLSRYLTKAGYNVREASCLAEAREGIVTERFDAIILDMMLPDGNGISWIEDLREHYPEIAIIVITGAGDIPLAVGAMRRGADNFLTKPLSMSELDVFLRKSLELSALRRKNLAHQRTSEEFQPYFGESPTMKKMIELAAVAVDNDSTALLTGETGTGKGILARWIYERGPKKSGPFVEVNCSGLRSDLLASELFGHVRGAFTSAVQDRKGLIEIADGGTLFLDEIGDMDFTVQSQFLKVLEERHYRRLGEVIVRKSNFRLIAATNKDLAEETRKDRFRKDLFFRINVFPIHIPPLRERPEDMSGLVRHFLHIFHASHTEISSEVMSLIRAYPWPGNVRELKNVLERALLLARGRQLSPEHFPGVDISAGPADAVGGEMKDIEQIEEDYLRTVIERSGGDIPAAARKMGISRATLYRRLKKFTQ